MIYRTLSTVLSTEEISEGIYQTYFFSSDISGESKPGQFVNILPSLNWVQVMRRPMSIASQKDGEISIIYKAIGEGTRLMSQWEPGEEVDLIGPLGNYWEGYESTFPVLIGGGVGIAPILNLHHHLLDQSIEHILIMGARNNREHFLPHNPDNNIYMSTDDGSLGIDGNVVDALSSVSLSHMQSKNAKIFSCGPPGMMEAVRSYSLEKNVNCDLALETIMACGFGICQGCTVERKKEKKIEHSYRNRFALACLDGPIFSAKEILTCG